jgi:Methyltransferase domain.
MVAGLPPTVQEIKPVSNYWKHLNSASDDLLKEYGYEHFKESVARIYNDDMGHDEIMESTRELWDYLYNTIPTDVLCRYSEPMVGSPRYILCDQRPVTIDLGVSIRDAYEIGKHINLNNIDRIVEIGGGYGRLPYIITQNNNFVRYTMCDVEPALSIAKWYLPQVVKANRIDYCHPEELEGKTDLVIACNCLHEMTPEQVHYYFDYCDKNAQYLYFNCWKNTTVPMDGILWEQGDYPVREKMAEDI